MARGQFSLVVALYNVAEYVPAFLESLRTQAYPVQDLDIVVVDDGSTDTSAALVERWGREHHPGLRLVRQENAGPGAARNTGLRLARNTWVTFCDPDDVFHPGYFQEVDKFLQGDVNGSAQLLATRLVQFTDGTAKMNHNHPLGKKFRFGNTLVSLDNNPEFIQLHGPTAFLRREILAQHGLTFDERIRPKFEDSHLIGRYLAAVEEPVLGIVASARYLYRRNRQHGASLVAAAWADPRAYDDLPRYGYLGMLQAVQGQLGRIPHWAQYMVLYDLIWFYIDDKRMHSVTAGATSLQQERMHGLLEQIVELIDVEVIDEFTVVSQGWIFHNILRRHYKQLMDDPPVIQEGKHDEQRGTVRYSYLFLGDHPEEKTYLDGAPIVPNAAKVRDHRVLGRTLIKERVLILPEGAGLEIHLDGVPAVITTNRGVPFQPGRLPDQLPGFRLVPPAVAAGPGHHPASYIRPLGNRAGRFRQNRILHRSITGAGGLAEARDSGTRYVQRIISRGKALRQKTADRRLVARAAQEPAASRYKDAWLLMDRIGRADDNAEHLYRYLLRERPEINAWFLLERTSRDWDRLAAEGFKLVAYGSDESVLLYLNAAFKISSHLNANIEFPVSKRRFGTGRARFVFLQHGVIKDDMSLWLNTKETALMITATYAEHESIAGDGPYDLTRQEVKLVGFPRHDALLKSAELNPVHLRRQILMAPTWREYLRNELETAGSPMERVELFERSDFGRNWLQLLRSQALGEFCQRNGYEVVFLPHPELESMVPLLKLPAYVRAAAYSEISVQGQLVQARMMVTDHSSLAFDAAYAGAKIVYFHFDGDEIFGGGHVYRKGYFDYRRDGLGPIAEAPDQVVRELAARDGRSGPTLYDKRVRSTFPYWDSQSSVRTISAIEDLNGTRPVGAEGRGHP
ncbi:bifunctional glycosyltransferase/CDP-glycerol:glycerophosphate glycerophosphotransferase [Arthrobacter yangruifuii]|uniref:bifunctional glycosyltransferase/CDP-glycerol:glycerophosphate glycerophosphotransferase n=1 Tax=Arthrobacter yangruifuii TaxID=2606616 RepID=UPI0011B62A9E|nr:glycosyltransferase [Arthrobacter yangruifuii]